MSDCGKDKDYIIQTLREKVEELKTRLQRKREKVEALKTQLQRERAKPKADPDCKYCAWNGHNHPPTDSCYRGCPQSDECM